MFVFYPTHVFVICIDLLGEKEQKHDSDRCLSHNWLYISATAAVEI